MSKGLSSNVVRRLWRLFSLMRLGVKRSELAAKMSYSPASLAADIFKLKSAGFTIKHSRKSDQYAILFPKSEPIPVKLTQEEFFLAYMAVGSFDSNESLFSDLIHKLDLSLSEETASVHDIGPAYGIARNVTEEIKDVLSEFDEAIRVRRKVAFLYEKKNSSSSLRVAHPYKLCHTPVSWYVIAFCEDKQDFRKFKLSRISHIRILNEKFERRPFSIEEHIRDAWWIQYDPARIDKPYEVKVLFTGEAAKSIREYKFHDSQELEFTDEGTYATWKLSYLDEFASWLMQWLENIEIIKPRELQDIIDKKIWKFEQKKTADATVKGTSHGMLPAS